ncbi:hypothetical protein [Burkholderia gladioli]|uniref:hypothetical protein n=1 Tax=Burkholderia gladioli TaxID=28095 RepID=UPI0016403EC0|nr:hypothetical protein [Burkholderia gladioli]
MSDKDEKTKKDAWAIYMNELGKIDPGFEKLLRETEDLISDLRKDDIANFELLKQDAISLATLARNIAYEGLGFPKRALSQAEETERYTTFRQCIRLAKKNFRDGTLILREPKMLLPISPEDIQWWIDAEETLQSESEMVDSRYVIKRGEARQWLARNGLKIPKVLGVTGFESDAPSTPAATVPKNQPDAFNNAFNKTAEKTPAPAKDFGRQVRWRQAIIVNWPGIVAAHGASASAQAILRYLKSNDETGYIVKGGAAYELVWTTACGAQRTVSRKTVANAVSELRAQGQLKA